jgi:protein phosphatase 1 regulatory subunit 37
VEEEGEIFRKGNVLLGPEEMEGEYAGEDLRREVGLLFIAILT